jgi:predicted nuclease of restriction endonuclease-like RecB superfamily
LVRVRKTGTELSVIALSSPLRKRAVSLGQELIALAEACVGGTRQELGEAWASVETKASEQKLSLGLQKLLEDRMEFEMGAEGDPRTLRSALFLRAAEERATSEVPWQRDDFLQREACERGTTPPGLLTALYADLRQSQRVMGFMAPTPEGLVQDYELAQQQAVFLRAVDVIADVRCKDAYGYRALFRKLKFLRLLHRIEARVDGGYRITIDGPFSIFGPSTKYGLELALAVPQLLACDQYAIAATLRWGKERAKLTYKVEGKALRAADREPARLPDDVQAFYERFAALESSWECSVSSDILDLPGFGLCVPDLRFVARDTGEVVYLEVMGHWSREAVWRRVELVQAGLSARVIFAVSRRLRVSEEVLPEELPSELYVYKGALLPKEVLRRLSGRVDAE